MNRSGQRGTTESPCSELSTRSHSVIDRAETGATAIVNSSTGDVSSGGFNNPQGAHGYNNEAYKLNPPTCSKPLKQLVVTAGIT